MRFSDLAGKEIIDLDQGVRLGVLGEADIVFESRTGRVRAIVIAERGSWWHRGREIVVPWRGIRKIGVDLIVVDLSTAVEDGDLDDDDRDPPSARMSRKGMRTPSDSIYFPRER